MRQYPTRTSPRVLMAVAVGAALLGGSGTASAAPHPTAWTANLSDQSAHAQGVHRSHGTITLAADAPSPAAEGRTDRQGSYTMPPHALGTAANRVSVTESVTAPAGTTATVLVRGRTAAGRWTEWRQATPKAPAVLPAPAGTVQVRLVLTGTAKSTPTVRQVGLRTDPVAGTPRLAGDPLTAKVFATREGLVGKTTSNGHVIQPGDHFVALPSPRALNANDGTRDYQVKVCNPGNGRCETAPVWDVGPWNTHDDYWNPSDQREQWKDLPQGKPEAQAANQDGYNGGKDEFGRTVASPAGIDLADGTFTDGLGLGDNGWVDVTYLWTGGS